MTGNTVMNFRATGPQIVEKEFKLGSDGMYHLRYRVADPRLGASHPSARPKARSQSEPNGYKIVKLGNLRRKAANVAPSFPVAAPSIPVDNESRAMQILNRRCC